MEVTLITNPKYTVNFAQYQPQEKKAESLSLPQRTYNVGVEVIKFFGVVVSSIFHAGYLTLRYAARSFARLVLNSFGVTDFYFGAFKVAYWAYSLGFTFLATTIRNVINAYSSSNALYLARFVKRGIDLSHIQSKGVQLDASHVPGEIKVADLLTLLDAINFNAPEDPGYMAPTARKEGNTTYSVEELRKNLEKFVERVNGRVAFLGTPPAHDTVCLNAFYQQIEDAIRLSLYKVRGDLVRFKAGHPDLGGLGAEDLANYKNLLEDQARLAVDLAIAGKHCGARYMGEAMTSYYNFHGDAEPSGTLEDTLIELLAAKRNEVAQAEIQRYLGASTHGFSQYMQHMGGFLAIPGTENVIEHLSGTFDYTRYLRSFFEIYTEDFIIDAIQERIKKSQAFREQIIDWFKMQVGEGWLPDDLPTQEEVVAKLEEEMDASVDTDADVAEIEFFCRFLSLKEGEVHALGDAASFPNLDEGWEEFVRQLFGLDEAKAIFQEVYPDLGIMDRVRKRLEIVQKLMNPFLGKALEKQYSEIGTITIDQGLLDQITLLIRVEKMRSHLPVDEEVLLRILQKETQIDDVVRGYLEGPLQNKFLYALNIEGMPRKGLSPVLLEWLLDAHQIFAPKNLTQEPTSYHSIAPEKAQTYRGAIDPDGNMHQMQGGEPSLVEEVLVPLLKEDYVSSFGKRYVFGAGTDIQEIAYRIFEKAFKEKANRIVLVAESMLPSDAPFYPNWKGVAYIRTPEIGAKIFGSNLLKVVLSCLVIYKLVKLTRQAYEQSGIWANRLHRYMTKEAPPQVAEAYRSAYKVHHWIIRNKWKLFIYGQITRFFLSRIPHPLARRGVKFIDPSIGMHAGSYFGILFKIIWSSLTFTWTATSKISSTLQYTADRAKEERLSLQKKRCYALWNQVIF